ncbi:hypothetical protein J1N51_13555 [Psychrosphaera ytuae]|uniref:TonB-dependent receptor-like beta-barrel domain-containing protein n=1 Tax=Psychrosphaera ytuae TaxID=2820710 RepID=A0A975DAU2_9GAMM|nr:hypothetical protein [Psychrosphaera ytuae]QTH63726.1 hypothetical protein J1N51_13555 [Psychrosphaera ytuae]
MHSANRTSVAIAVLTAILCTSYSQFTWAQSQQAVEDDEPTSKIEKIRVIGAKDAGLELSSEKILKVPGAGNDPIKAIESLPGVVLARGFAPAVRGSSPNDMYYQSDDVPVGNVFHLDSFSTFHPNLIQSFELKTGAWEAEFYDAIGGVIDTRLREPEAIEPRFIFDLSFLRTGLLYESKVGDDSAMYFAVRQSLVHLYIENILEDEEDFSFDQAPINNDYQFKFVTAINDDNKLTVQATGSNDEVALLFDDNSDEVLKNPDLRGEIGADQYYHNQSLIWTNYSEYGETKTILNRLERSGDIVIGQILDLDATTTDYLFKVKNNQEINQGELFVGAEWRRQNVDYAVTGKQQPCNNEFEICPPTYYSDSTFEQSSIDINFTALYADYDWDVTEDWTAKLGVVYSHNDYTDESFIEPRATIRWQVSNDYRIKLAAGQHHQWFRQYKYLSETFGAKELELVTSDHYVAGLEYVGDSDWAWRLETYYKEMDKLIVSNPAQQSNSLSEQGMSGSAPNYLNAGVGDAYGVEFLLNKAISNKWYGWVSIAYSHTERYNPITGKEFDFEYDLPWIVNMVANYEYNERWQIGGRWRLQSGALTTPIVGADAVYPLDSNGQPDQSQDAIFYDPIEGEFNSERLDYFHRLDVRVDYKTEWFGKQTNVYFEVLNVYGQKSVEGYEYNADYTEREEEYQFPESPIPSIGFQMVF